MADRKVQVSMLTSLRDNIRGACPQILTFEEHSATPLLFVSQNNCSDFAFTVYPTAQLLGYNHLEAWIYLLVVLLLTGWFADSRNFSF